MEKQPESAPITARKDAAVIRVLWTVLAVNLAVAGLELAVGLWIGSLALFAGAVHSLLDASSNVVGLIGVGVGSKPPDRRHPYGHRRFESIASLVIGVFIAAGLVEILHEAWATLAGQRDAPSVTWLAILAVTPTIFINLALSRYEHSRGKSLRSSLLHADSLHTLSDALSAVVVLGSLVGVKLGVGWLDIAAACVVSLIIAHAAWQILFFHFGLLVDRAALDPEQVQRIALSVDGVTKAGQVRSRRAGDVIYLDLTIQLDGSKTLAAAHDTTHEVIELIQQALPEVGDVVIHTEPDQSTGPKSRH